MAGTTGRLQAELQTACFPLKEFDVFGVAGESFERRKSSHIDETISGKGTYSQKMVGELTSCGERLAAPHGFHSLEFSGLHWSAQIGLRSIVSNPK